ILLLCDYDMPGSIDGFPLGISGNDPFNCCVINLGAQTATGIESLDKLKAEIYPTLSNGKLNIRTDECINSVTITDLTGKLVFNGLFENNIHQLDVSKLYLKGEYV